MVFHHVLQVFSFQLLHQLAVRFDGWLRIYPLHCEPLMDIAFDCQRKMLDEQAMPKVIEHLVLVHVVFGYGWEFIELNCHFYNPFKGREKPLPPPPPSVDPPPPVVPPPPPPATVLMLAAQ